MTVFKIGMKLSSAVGTGQVMVIKSRLPEGDLRCAGAPMLSTGEVATADVGQSTSDETLQTGKRYTDAAERIELLCVKPGAGPLTLDGEQLLPKQAKKLPSSD